MRFVDIMGVFLGGIVKIAALSLVLAPSSTTANVITSFGNAAGGLVSAAKG